MRPDSNHARSGGRRWLAGGGLAVLVPAVVLLWWFLRWNAQGRYAPAERTRRNDIGVFECRVDADPAYEVCTLVAFSGPTRTAGTPRSFRRPRTAYPFRLYLRDRLKTLWPSP